MAATDEPNPRAVLTPVAEAMRKLFEVITGKPATAVLVGVCRHCGHAHGTGPRCEKCGRAK